MSDAPPIVLPFFRASVVLREADRQVWDANVADDAFLDVVRQTPVPFRHNLRRLLVASTLAHEEGADLVFAEGWNSNRLDASAASVCGAEVFTRMLQVLQDRAYTSFSGTVHRLDASCCTWQEIRVVHEAFPDRRILGVTSSPCPSAARARRYLRIITAHAEVHSNTSMDDRASALFSACDTPAEGFTEAINWGVHTASECLRFFWRSDRPLEMRLAQAMRR